jgi:hypothetical protein
MVGLQSLKRRTTRLTFIRLVAFKPLNLKSRAKAKGERTMSNSMNVRLGSVTGRDEFIIGEALATALIALEQLPEARQPTRNMSDMKMLLNSIFPPPEALHMTTAR